MPCVCVCVVTLFLSLAFLLATPRLLISPRLSRLKPLAPQSVMSRFGKELVKLKCTVCNEHGLMRCPACRAAVELAMSEDNETTA